MTGSVRRLRALALVALGLTASALPSLGGAAPGARGLDPELFAQLSSGIALVRSFDCHGNGIEEGSGFLVGSSIVMTAGHVVRGACKNHIKVLLGGKWYAVAGRDYWFRRGQRKYAIEVDVSTLQLTEPSGGHLFTISTSSPRKGTNLSALGHPLGNEISLNQGHVVLKMTQDTVPLLAVRMLGAEGGSGSPLVDDEGNVVGILQRGLGGLDILGQRTAGVIIGIDLPSWWNGETEQDLCSAYKNGGIPDCNAITPPPPPSGEPGGRLNPWPVGTTAAAGEWTLKVNCIPNFDGWSVVGPVDPSNPKPPGGYVDAVVSLTATYSGSGTGNLSNLEKLLSFNNISGYVSSPYYQSCGIAPHPNAGDGGALAPNQSATLNICTMLPSGYVPGLELTADTVYFALH